MGKVITFGLQKGGVSKTTTTGIFSYLFSQEGYKTLAVDMDSQGNLTEFLSGVSANEFFNRSVLEAMVFQDSTSYLHPINENLDLLPANNLLALFPRWLYTGYIDQDRFELRGTSIDQLDRILEPLREKYDYIFIDTPPALSEQTTNALVASDYVIIPYECSYFCYQALPNFFKHVNNARKASKYKIDVLGISRTLSDKKRSDAEVFNRQVKEEYPDLVFDTIITRKAETGRLAFNGFEENKELKTALKQYYPLLDEIKKRLGITITKKKNMKVRK